MPANKINNILIFFFIKFQFSDSSHKKNRTRECGFRIVEQKKLFEIFRPPLSPFALRAFGDIFNFSFFEHGLHYDFSAAVGTHEFMR